MILKSSYRSDKKHRRSIMTGRPESYRPLIPGQTVTYQDVNTGNWFPATVVTKAPEPRSYLIKTPGGHILRRNRVHIRGNVSATNVTRRNSPTQPSQPVYTPPIILHPLMKQGQPPRPDHQTRLDTPVKPVTITKPPSTSEKTSVRPTKDVPSPAKQPRRSGRTHTAPKRLIYEL